MLSGHTQPAKQWFIPGTDDHQRLATMQGSDWYLPASMMVSRNQTATLTRSVIIALRAMDPRDMVIDAQKAEGIVAFTLSHGFSAWNQAARISKRYLLMMFDVYRCTAHQPRW
jgi:hypothetical protein